ncbi:hypothetical protein C8J57DRAFT_491294 [Mycena rebaudengoi]|nr:hypothetical protein C8J57DRAFT_491294 [Mycena rebaudengoi]
MDPRRYYNPTSNSLSAAGMSNIYGKPTHRPSSAAGYYGGAPVADQMYPSTTSSRGNSQSQSQHRYPYQHNNANNFGFQVDPSGFMGTTSPMSPASPPNYGFNDQMAYPSMPANSTGWISASSSQYIPSQAVAQPMSAESWNNMLMSTLSNQDSVSPYTSSSGSNSTYPSTAASPTGPSYSDRRSRPRSGSTSGMGHSAQSTFSIKQCYHCRATSTPLWRRDPVTHETLCNACGLYLQQRHAMRPQELIDADEDANDSVGVGNQDGPECVNCHARHTTVWRRNKAGEQVCNACGVYARLNGKDRPPELRKNKIRPRGKQSQG